MVVKSRRKGYRVAITLSDTEREKLTKVLAERKQTANEFITLAVWDFVRSDKPVEMTHRTVGITRKNRINFFTSEYVYDEIEKKANRFNRSMSEVIYTAIKEYLV